MYGCVVKDGAAIDESGVTMRVLEGAGAEMVLKVPNSDQLNVINKANGEEIEGEARNVLVESARIARGEIKDIVDVTSEDIDALIFPGGFGVVKNLCDYAMTGADCSVNPDVYRLVSEVHRSEKPIGVICISPAMMGKVMEKMDETVSLTIGNDEQTAHDLTTMGAKHVTCPVQEIVVDKDKKVVSTPAYMLAGRISEAADGIEKLVKEVINLI